VSAGNPCPDLLRH